MSGAALAFGAGVALKATLLLLAAWAAAAALRRASAAARHLVWAAAVAGLLALPPAALALPGWRVPVPRLLPAEPAAGHVPPARALPARGVPPRPPAAARPAGPEGAASPAPGTPAAAWALALWAAGALALLARVLAGTAGVRRLVRGAEPVRDPVWDALLREAAGALGLRRPVRLLRGGRSAMPLTWGTLRPGVLLPAAADGWAPGRRRAVLLHELAHVARGDCLVQTLAQLARALFWFHPLAWLAVRRLRAERELACDDRVLRAGTAPAEYARHLLEVARSCRAPRLAGAAVAMARPSRLEGRLLAVLDGSRDRGEPSRRLHLAACGAALALLLPLAALRPGDAARAQQPGRVAPAPRGEDAAEAPPAEVVALLAEIAFADADPQVRREAAETLGGLPGDHGTAELARIARTYPDPEVRAEAAEALGEKATGRAVEVLVELVERERAPAVLDEAVEALADAREHPGALPALERIARGHRDPRVRAAALEALAGAR